MKLSIIAAVAKNGVIGLNGGIPWNISEDMQYFKQITMGHRVIMGRKTWESLGRSLKGRQNVIVSTGDSAFSLDETIITVNSIEEALALPQWGEHEEVFCIGGAKLYAGMMSYASKLYLTEIDKDFEGDTYFPQWDRDEWKLTSTLLKTNWDLQYRFNIYERI